MKYVLVAGDVESKDEDIHHISAYKLAELYELNSKDCIFDNYPDGFEYFGNNEDQIWLEPRSEGDYKEYLEMVMECYVRERDSQPDSCFNCKNKKCEFYYTVRSDICIAYTRDKGED